MNKHLLALFSVITLSTTLHAELSPPAIHQSILPAPSAIQVKKGTLSLDSSTSVSLGKGTETTGRHFIHRLKRGTGWQVAESPKGNITLAIDPNPDSPEAYKISITADGIQVKAASAQGIARAAETLFQLMPPGVYGEAKITELSLPLVTINDAPRFAWRALSLDVSRRFQNKDTIIKLLDGMAACKLNIFHWHLTDDQGWRLPIDGYPNLTKDPNVSYSRADVREIVEHAEKLGISIMPEIDIPGHSNAACQAYPEIATKNKEGKVTNIINATSPAAYQFLETVFADVAKQFPHSKYIHIGCDEVGSHHWPDMPEFQAFIDSKKLKNHQELMVYFINWAAATVKKHGRTPAAWNEALRGGVDKDIVILSWQGMPPGISSSKAGHKTVFCPTPQIYFDHPNSRSIKNPHAYSDKCSYLNHCYFFNPALPAVAKENRNLILGGEACIWSECIKDADHMFILAFPRAWAIGETLWSQPAQKDWDSFVSRLELQRQRFVAMNIPIFWEPETVAQTIGGWKLGDIAKNKNVIDTPLKGILRQPGLQEFFVGQGEGEGQFLIERMELIKDGAVIATDNHAFESSVFKDAKSMYLLEAPDIKADLTLRIHVKQLWGDSSATIQLTHALPLDQYSKQCGPKTGSNRTAQSK